MSQTTCLEKWTLQTVFENNKLRFYEVKGNSQEQYNIVYLLLYTLMVSPACSIEH